MASRLPLIVVIAGPNGAGKTTAQGRESFAFETTLASRSFAPWLRTRRAEGYRVHLAFLSLPTEELEIARVRERVRLGGHDVPEPVIRRRFVLGLRKFFTIYREIADEWQMFDNSDVRNPRPIASGRLNAPPAMVDEIGWNTLMERSR